LNIQRGVVWQGNRGLGREDWFLLALDRKYSWNWDLHQVQQSEIQGTPQLGFTGSMRDAPASPMDVQLGFPSAD
jgi:hypothetical protein